MASASAPRSNAAAGRINSAASTLCSDNESLIAEIRKAQIMMKEIAVDLERDNKHPEKVKELEAGVIQLLEATDDCTRTSAAIQSVANRYPLESERTDFKKLLDDEIAKSKASSSRPQNNPLLRQFREAIWNVHHAGQPMPGEEQEDIVMTSTQCNLLNITCPLSGKPVTELAEPVRSMECKHIYEKKAVMQYIKSKNSYSRCPMAGCPKILVAERVVCDPLLRVEIDEMRAMNKQTVRTGVIEDFTYSDEEEVDED